MGPQLSLIIPTFNRRRFLRSAVLSALHCRGVPLEVIVVDDGSSDDSQRLLKDLPIVYLKNPENQGLGYSRNRGVLNARGEYIAFLDSDDLLKPNALEQQICFLESHPKIPVVGGMVGDIIDAYGSSIPFPVASPPAELSLEWLKSHFYPCGVWLYVFRTSLFHRFGLFDEGLIVNDVEMMLRILSEQTIPMRRVPMVSLRQHDNNISHQLVNNTLRYPKNILAECLLVNCQYHLNQLIV